MSTKIIAFESSANTYKEILLSSAQELKISDATTHGYLDEVESKLSDIGIKAAFGKSELQQVAAGAIAANIIIDCRIFRKLRIYGDSAENFSFNLAFSDDGNAFNIGDSVPVFTVGSDYKFSLAIDCPANYVSIVNTTAVNLTNINLYWRTIN